MAPDKQVSNPPHFQADGPCPCPTCFHIPTTSLIASKFEAIHSRTLHGCLGLWMDFDSELDRFRCPARNRSALGSLELIDFTSVLAVVAKDGISKE